MSIKKCGNFMEKNSVVIKRPGKKFICPPMPKKMKISCEHLGGNVREDIDQMNALKEQNWKKERWAEYEAIRRLYYFQELVRFVRRTCNRVLCIVTLRKASKKTVDPSIYIDNRSPRQHS